MICTETGGEAPIRISISPYAYFRYDESSHVFFYTGDDLAKYKLPMIGPDVLTRWEDETSIR